MCPGPQSKPATRRGRGPVPCTSCPASFSGPGTAFFTTSALATTPHTEPLPHSLSEALDGFHPRTFLARLSGHLLQDMTLVHSTLDLWKGVGSGETLSWAPPASLPGASFSGILGPGHLQGAPLYAAQSLCPTLSWGSRDPEMSHAKPSSSLMRRKSHQQCQHEWQES